MFYQLFYSRHLISGIFQFYKKNYLYSFIKYNDIFRENSGKLNFTWLGMHWVALDDCTSLVNNSKKWLAGSLKPAYLLAYLHIYLPSFLLVYLITQISHLIYPPQITCCTHKRKMRQLTCRPEQWHAKAGSEVAQPAICTNSTN